MTVTARNNKLTHAKTSRRVESDLKMVVYGKRLTSRIFFDIKSKSRTVKRSSYTIY